MPKISFLPIFGVFFNMIFTFYYINLIKSNAKNSSLIKEKLTFFKKNVDDIKILLNLMSQKDISKF